MAELKSDDSEEAMIHGGGAKVGRIHFAIEAYNRAVDNSDLQAQYRAVDKIFLEVVAYLNDDEKKGIYASVEKVNKYIEVIRRGGSQPSFYGENRLLLIKLWRTLRRLNLDMAPKDKKMWLTGAV